MQKNNDHNPIISYFIKNYIKLSNFYNSCSNALNIKKFLNLKIHFWVYTVTSTMIGYNFINNSISNNKIITDAQKTHQEHSEQTSDNNQSTHRTCPDIVYKCHNKNKLFITSVSQYKFMGKCYVCSKTSPKCFTSYKNALKNCLAVKGTLSPKKTKQVNVNHQHNIMDRHYKKIRKQIAKAVPINVALKNQLHLKHH